MADIWDVDDWVDGMASLPVKRFYPTAVAQDTALPLKVAFDRLLQLVKDQKLLLLWEVRCPNYECIRTINVVRDPYQVIGETINCNICGEEIEITPDLVFPVFELNPDYKERIRQKKTNRVGPVFAASRALRTPVPSR